MNFPFGALANAIYRVFILARENPCTIEEIVGKDGGQWIRVRNDSKTVVQLFDVSFRWKPKGSSKFSVYSTPMAWLLSKQTDRALEPGHSFEHPVNAAEQGTPMAEFIISIRHNRQPKPAEKKFAVKS